MTTYTVTVYTKSFKTKEGKTFKKTLCQYENKHFNCLLSENVRNRLIKEDLALPVQMELASDHYFIKKENYTKPDGTTGVNKKVVIMDFVSVEQAHFKRESLEDLM